MWSYAYKNDVTTGMQLAAAIEYFGWGIFTCYDSWKLEIIFPPDMIVMTYDLYSSFIASHCTDNDNNCGRKIIGYSPN